MRKLMLFVSTAGTGYMYVTPQREGDARRRPRLRRYDPVAKRHVLFVLKTAHQ